MKDRPPSSPATVKPAFFSHAVEQERTFYREKPGYIDGVAVICGGREQSAANYRIDRESFPYFCLEWVAAGRGALVLAGQSHALEPGSFFVYGPGVPHRITTDPHERLVKYFVNFSGPAARRLLKRNRLPVPYYRTILPGVGFLEIFDRVIEAGASTTPSSLRVCRLLLECLIVLAGERHPSFAAPPSRAYQTYLRCREHMEKNLRHLSRIEDVAHACHIAPAYLTRVFRRFSGESPHRFLIRSKMKSAALHLIRHNALIKETADYFGYADPYHFSKSFKRIHGLSPENYLRSRQAEIA
jgi:AraC-like DNA-binding protein